MIDISGDTDFTAFGLALAGEHFDQLPLAVAGDAGNADDLARAHRERDIAHRGRAGIVQRVEFFEFEPGFAGLTCACGWMVSSSAPIMLRAMSSG